MVGDREYDILGAHSNNMSAIGVLYGFGSLLELSDSKADYIVKNIPGDCLLAIADEDVMKIHYHTNTPWKVLEYASTLGDIYDVVVENMERQENGLKG